MSLEDEAKAYQQALIDAGLIDLESPIDAQWEEFMSEMDLKEELRNSGTWFIQVYKDHGTIFEKEVLRIQAPRDGEIVAGAPKGTSVVNVGPQSVIKMFIDKLNENYKQTNRTIKGHAEIRKAGEESKDVDK